MADQEQIHKLLKEGVEAARAGNPEKAQKLFLKVTELDESNERAWLWMATVASSDDEKRVYLGNVLYINPNNEKAQQMLDQLEGKEQAATAHEDELAPGIQRGRIMLYGGGVAILYLVVMIALFAVGMNRRGAYNQQVAFIATESAGQVASQTQQVLNLTETQIVAATETATALQAIATFTPTNNPNLPTLPPTWTPIPSPTDASIAQSTPLAVPPVDIFANAIIAGWGGRDRLNNGTRPLAVIELNDPNNIQEIGTMLVRSATINPANGQELFYTRYYTTTATFGLERSNINGTQQQPVGIAWFGRSEGILEQRQGQLNYTGDKLIFVGPGATTTDEIWILDLNFPDGPGRLTQVTNDSADYSYPSLSPDGTRVVAVKVDRNSLAPFEDVVMIDLASGEQTPITSDEDAFIESYTHWLPNGEEIAFVISEGSAEAPGDIIRLSVTNPDAPARYLIRTETDERAPTFSADGSYMAYASNRTGQYNIFIRELASEADYQVTNSTEFPYFPGGLYIPNLVPARPLSIIPTPPFPDAESPGEGGANGEIPESLQATLDAAEAGGGGANGEATGGTGNSDAEAPPIGGGTGSVD